jgi:methyltransferase (TIGR00027 family)
MRGDGSSRTAYSVALRRAAHQVLDNPKVFEDPLAISILGPEATRRIQTASVKLDRRRRAFMAARSRYAEDQLARAIDRGVRQYVVLGAGLDTYAYRSRTGVRVFEADHPATQKWKRATLKQSGIEIPKSLVFVPVDLEQPGVGEQLEASGLDLSQPVFFSWLGTMMYLTMNAVMSTFRLIASCRAGSGVAFDYTLSRSAMNPWMRARQRLVAMTLARWGEPLLSSFVPADLAGLLRELAFRDLEDLSSTELDQRYFDRRADGLKIGKVWGRVASAWV